jgi:hypothetical protein
MGVRGGNGFRANIAAKWLIGNDGSRVWMECGMRRPFLLPPN